MTFIEDLVSNFQALVAQVPELVQPLIVALAGAIPFIEGEGGAIIGIVGGIHPVVAGIAAAVGNFLCVLVVVLLGARARRAVVDYRAATRVPTLIPVGAGGTAAATAVTDAQALSTETGEPESKGRQRFKKWVVRFGVPGASLLGPLAIPTQITSAILVASGIPVKRVLLWQAIAIVLWTTVATVSITLAISLLYSA